MSDPTGTDRLSLPVSVIVMTRNEAANIAACLDSLADFGEIFVVDSYSDDETASIARARGALVFDFRWDGKYPKKKQWCLEELPFTYSHVLYVDADERMRPELAAEIAAAVSGGEAAGWFVGLDYVWMGRVLRHGAIMYKLALFDRGRGRFVEWDDLDAERMWEVEGHYQPRIDGPTRTLRGRLLHDDHHRLYDWFDRHNRYSDWEAVVRANTQIRAETQPVFRSVAKRLFAIFPCKPLISFVYAVVIKQAWRDGVEGMQFALAKAVYQWQIDLKVAELRRHTRL